MKKAIIALVLILTAVFVTTAVASKMDSVLHEFMPSAQPNDLIPVYVLLQDQVDLRSLKADLKNQQATLAERHRQVIYALQDKRDNTQTDILDYLAQEQRNDSVKEYKSLWIGNYIILTAKPQVIQAIANRSDVARVYYDIPIEFILPVENSAPVTEESPRDRNAEGGLLDINAHLLWAEGITGEGRLVANMDTGVEGSHPALSPKWRGNNGATPAESWYDPTGQSMYPTQFGAHGTHTMGTMVGSNDATGDTVGVAFNAQWIATGWDWDNDADMSFISHTIQAYQWIADPDGDPETMHDVPDVINNSWGIPLGWGTPPCYDGFNAAIDGVEAAGCVVVFAAGNEGFEGLRAPGNRIASEVNVLSVGALNPGSNSIASFSSRGPSQCLPEPGQSDTLRIKPEVCARGVTVRSTVPGGGYESFGWDGTSMAAPHVAGAVALLRQISPNATPEEIKWALIHSAIDLDSPGNDNNTGFGRIDVYAASLLLGGFIEGYITLSNQTEHANIKVWDAADETNFTFTDEYGFYQLKGLSEGTHNLIARHQGYYDAEIVDIEITLGETVYEVNTILPAIDGTPVNLSAASEINGEVPLVWDNPPVAPAAYNVYRSETSSGPYEPIAAGVADNHYNDMDVRNGKRYYYVVTAIYANPYGESFYSPETNAVPGETVVLPFVRDFEENEGNLYQTLLEPGVQGSVWEYGPINPGHGPGATLSGSYVWATGLSGNYANQMDAYLLTPLINLTGTSTPKIVIDHWYEFEGYDVRAFDGGNVALSTDAGDSWQVLHPVDGYDDLGVPGLDQEAGFSFESGTWQTDQFDMSAFINEVVIVRFRAGSDLGINKAGWFLDNVRIVDAAIGIEDEDTAIEAMDFKLEQNYPNPFNPSTVIRFQLPAADQTDLSIYNTSGQLVTTLINDHLPLGQHETVWDGRNEAGQPVGSGIYFYHLSTDSGYDETRSMILLK